MSRSKLQNYIFGGPEGGTYADGERATVRTFVSGSGKPPREPEPEPEPEPQAEPNPGQLEPCLATMPAASQGGAADDLPGRVLL